MEWIQVFDGVFFITIATIVFGFLGLSVRFCYKSKCKEVSFCGFHLIRDTENEEKLDALEIQTQGPEENEEESKD
jgi:hypothetical protein